jgi:hypothetical protein
MRGFKLIAGVLTALGLGACSTVIEGSSQMIRVDTSPPGANCVFAREGQTIASVSSTPGTVKIDKTKYDITITCTKDGYQTATYLNHSGAAGATFGNIILGGGVGWAVDSATGSDNKYDSSVLVTLNPVVKPQS